MPQLADFRSSQQTRIAAEWLRAWLPALLWAGVITFASTDTFSSANTGSLLAPIVRWVYPAIGSEHLEAIHLFVRKAAHFAEYFIFYVLLYRGVRGRRTGWRWSWGLTAWIIAAATQFWMRFTNRSSRRAQLHRGTRFWTPSQHWWPCSASSCSSVSCVLTRQVVRILLPNGYGRSHVDEMMKSVGCFGG